MGWLILGLWFFVREGWYIYYFAHTANCSLYWFKLTGHWLQNNLCTQTFYNQTTLDINSSGCFCHLLILCLALFCYVFHAHLSHKLQNMSFISKHVIFKTTTLTVCILRHSLCLNTISSLHWTNITQALYMFRSILKHNFSLKKLISRRIPTQLELIYHMFLSDTDW